MIENMKTKKISLSMLIIIIAVAAISIRFLLFFKDNNTYATKSYCENHENKPYIAKNVKVFLENGDINITKSIDNKVHIKIYKIVGGYGGDRYLDSLSNLIKNNIINKDDYFYMFCNVGSFPREIRLDISVHLMVPIGTNLDLATNNGDIRIGEAYWGPYLKQGFNEFNITNVCAGKSSQTKFSESGKIYISKRKSN